MIRRLGSPSGPSTLITSAPQSPSTTAAAGAAMNELISSTRNPARGRPGSVIEGPRKLVRPIKGAGLWLPSRPAASVFRHAGCLGDFHRGTEEKTELHRRPDRRPAVRRAGDLRSSLHEDPAYRP